LCALVLGEMICRRELRPSAVIRQLQVQLLGCGKKERLTASAVVRTGPSKRMVE
jgi:hypothetical protein